jgi:F0F1-type ATP synthase membrane subunit b/b'
LAFIVLVGLGALALHLMRPARRQRRMRGELTQRPRRVALLSELVPRPRASTAVQVRKLMDVHLFEGSDRMHLRSRAHDAPTAPGSKATPESYDALGDRITSLLQAAEDAAEEIRQTAKQEAEDVRAQAERYSSEARGRADAAAAEKQAEAKAEADRVLRAAEERAERIEESAVEHREKVVAETEALQKLLDGRRLLVQEMIGAFRDMAGRLEVVVDGSSESDASAALPGQDVDINTQLDDATGRMDTRMHDGILSGEINADDIRDLPPGSRSACLNGVAMIAASRQLGLDPDDLARQVGPGFKGTFEIGERRLRFVPYFGHAEHARLTVHNPEPDVTYVLVVIDPPNISPSGWMTGREISSKDTPV